MAQFTMYHPLSDSLTSRIFNCQARFSTCVTTIRWFLVITCVCIVKIVCVSTRSHAICTNNNKKKKKRIKRNMNKLSKLHEKITRHKYIIYKSKQQSDKCQREGERNCVGTQSNRSCAAKVRYKYMYYKQHNTQKIRRKRKGGKN